MKGILSPLPEFEASLFISSETVTLTKFLSVQVTSEITAKQTNGNQSSPGGGEAGEGEKKKNPPMLRKVLYQGHHGHFAYLTSSSNVSMRWTLSSLQIRSLRL